MVFDEEELIIQSSTKVRWKNNSNNKNRLNK